MQSNVGVLFVRLLNFYASHLTMTLDGLQYSIKCCIQSAICLVILKIYYAKGDVLSALLKGSWGIKKDTIHVHTHAIPVSDGKGRKQEYIADVLQYSILPIAINC